MKDPHHNPLSLAPGNARGNETSTDQRSQMQSFIQQQQIPQSSSHQPSQQSQPQSLPPFQLIYQQQSQEYLRAAERQKNYLFERQLKMSPPTSLGSNQAISSSKVSTGTPGNTLISSNNEQPARDDKLAKHSLDTTSSSPLPKRPRSSKSEADNSEVTEGPAPEMDLDSITEDLKRQNVSELRNQLLERTYFVFDLDEDLWSGDLGRMIGRAMNAVCAYIKHILPTVSVAQIHKAFLELLDIERKNPLMREKSFDYRLRNRFSRLVHYLGLELADVPEICERLVAIYNKRLDTIQFELQPLIVHLYSIGKKVVFISKFKGGNSNGMFRGHMDLVTAETTTNEEQIPAPCTLVRIPIYIYDIDKIVCKQPAGAYGEVLKVSAAVSQTKEDRVLRTVMNNLPCDEGDIVFISRERGHIRFRDYLRVFINKSLEQEELSFTDEMVYQVDTFTTLKKILTDESH